MAASSLEFTLSMYDGAIVQGMARTREAVVAGLRGMSRAAVEEGGRIQSALNAITLSENAARRINDTRTALSAASTEATRLGNAFRQSQADLARMTGQIERATAELTRLRQTPAASRTDDQKDAISAAQQKIRNLRSQADALRGFASTLGRDSDRASASVSRLTSTLSSETTELSRLRTGLQSVGVDTNRLSDAQAALQTRMAQMATQARELQRVQAAKNVLNLAPNVNTDREIARVQAAYERLRVSGTLTTTELARAHVAMTEKIIALQNGTDSWGSRISLVREQLVKLAAAGAAIGTSVHEAIKFESAMANVAKVVQFKTPQQFAEMGNDLKAMSRAIPITLEDMAKMAEIGATLGIHSDKLKDFVDLVSKMAITFKMPTDEASSNIGKLMNVYHLSINEMSLLGDAITYLGQNMDAPLKSIIEFSVRSAAMGQTMGLTAKQVAALGSTLIATGMQPERASTGFNTLASTLTGAASKGADFQNAMRNIGISTSKFSSDLAKNTQGTLYKFLETLHSLDKVTLSETVHSLVGQGGDANDLLSLVNGFDRYGKAIALIKDESAYAGRQAEEFAIKTRTTEMQLRLMKNAVEEVAINLGTAFLPAITVGAQTVATLTHGLADLTGAFPVMSASVTTAIMAFAGFGALRLGLSLIRAEVIGLVVAMSGLTTASLAFIATPLGIALVAIGMAAWVVYDAMKSGVPPLLENAAALGKSRKETEEKVKTLQALQKTLAETKSGTQEYTNAEEKLAQLLPGATVSLDGQGRMLAKWGNAASDNAKKLTEYFDLIKKDGKQTLVLQLDAQTRAFNEAKKDVTGYADGLKNFYGIGEKTQTTFQKFTMWMDKNLGLYDSNIAKGAEFRRQLGDTEAGVKSLLAEARKAGLSVEDLGKAMDGIHADPAVREQVVAMFNGIEIGSGNIITKTDKLKENLHLFSIAMTSPAAIAKKFIVEAINVTSEQLGRYNDGLTKHREELKKAVDNEKQSWDAMGKAAEASAKESTDRITEEYDRRRNYLDSTIETGLRYDPGLMTSIPGPQVSQKLALENTTKIDIEESQAKLEVTRKYQKIALYDAEKQFNQIRAKSKELGLDANKIDEEMLQKKKEILGKVESSYKQNIDKLISEEKRHKDAAIQLSEQKAAYNLSMEDRFASLKEKGQKPEDVDWGRQQRIEQERDRAQKALDAGRYEEARAHAEKMASMAEKNSNEVPGVISSDDAQWRAQQQMNQAMKITNDSFDSQRKAHKTAQSEYGDAATDQMAQMQKLRDVTAELDANIAKDHRLVLMVEDSEILKASRKVDELTDKITRLNAIKIDLQSGATRLEKLPEQIDKGQLDQARQSIQMARKDFKEFAVEVKSFDPEIKSKFDINIASDSIDSLLPKFKELADNYKKLKDSINLNVETTEATNRMMNFMDYLNKIPNEKTVVVNYVERKQSDNYVEKKQTGGIIGFDEGGHLPGWGGGDRIHALLEAGEYVMRKEAVQRYGVGMMESINRMRVQLPEMPRYAVGGLVNNLVIPSLPPMPAFASGGPVAPPVEGVMRLDLTFNGRPEVSLVGPRQHVRGLVDALKELQRGML